MRRPVENTCRNRKRLRMLYLKPKTPAYVIFTILWMEHSVSATPYHKIFHNTVDERLRLRYSTKRICPLLLSRQSCIETSTPVPKSTTAITACQNNHLCNAKPRIGTVCMRFTASSGFRRWHGEKNQEGFGVLNVPPNFDTSLTWT